MVVYTSGRANAAESPETSHAIIMRQLVDGAVVRKGYSPYVGDNGNWQEYSDDTGKFEDTGVKAQGPQGEQGETGEQGPKGASGVYVGAEEPTDPDIDVWIDPQGVADRFVKTVNGVAPDENGNVQLPVYDGSVSE